ncbi:MAG: hypothetical protein HYW47_01745 [Deltaproteobacteria bacterium]|nr:hypothetical protein [Deltaproteobacteria bacterium]
MKETFYKKEIKVHGNVYPSIRQAALYFHLKPQLVWARLKRGKSIDEAFSKVYLKRIGKGKPFSIEGNHFDSIAEAARFYDINESTVRHRLKSGWSRKQAFGIVGRPRKDRIKIKVNNIEYSSLTEAARAHNLAPSIVWQRRRRGCSIEELFSKDCLPLKGKSRTIVVQDKTYPSAKIAAVKFGVHYSKVRWRLKNGWSPEQACGIEERPVKQRRPVSFRGKQHESMSTFARYYEKDPRLIGARLRRGLSIEEALDIKERNYRSKPITCL